MINQNELRIGNIIHFPFISDNVKVVGLALVENDKQIRIQTTISGNHNFFELAEKYTPIPLTEEWLLKAGFEKDDSGVEISDQDYCEWYQKEFPIIGILCQSSDKSYIFDEDTDTLKIKYVHELQNLYFSLVNEELVFSSNNA